MSVDVVDPRRLALLRQRAEGRLKGGVAPASLGWNTGAQALKLLHELQVHQVELDLQHEQMEQQLLELGGALRRAEQRGDALQALLDSAGLRAPPTRHD